MATPSKWRGSRFFRRACAADTVDGRFDALALVVALIMRRLKDCGEAGHELSQQLFDTCSRIWTCHYAKWAPVISVLRSGQVMAEAFMGRLDAYASALDGGDRVALAAALQRNLCVVTAKPANN